MWCVTGSLIIEATTLHTNISPYSDFKDLTGFVLAVLNVL